MKAGKWWALQSFLSCYIWNGVLIGFLFVISIQMLHGYHQWFMELMASTDGKLPESLKAGLLEMEKLLQQTSYLMPFVILGSGALFTTVLWLFLLLQGRGLARRAAIQSHPQAERTVPKAGGPGELKQKKETSTAAPIPEASPSPRAAIQMLAILQREGRLIDFLQEDLSDYDDAQIGAAVRSIHQNCKKDLEAHMELKPIIDEEEGSRVTVPQNFDPNAIRLTGNVTGEPPFNGALRHRGWRAEKVSLPITAHKDKAHWIIAPAEVEIGD